MINIATYHDNTIYKLLWGAFSHGIFSFAKRNYIYQEELAMSKKREMNNVASHGESELIRIMNQLRHDEICRKVAELDRCKNNAMREMRRTECSIAGLIDSGRGGKTGMHAFFGEGA